MATFKKQSMRATMMAFWSVIMTAMFAFLGAIPLRAMKTVSGSLAYWLLSFVCVGVVIALGEMYLAFAVGAMFLVVGLYSELEDMQLARGWSAFWSVSITALVATAATLFWRAATGADWYQKVLTVVQAPLDQVLKIQPEATLTASDLASQLPAVFLILVILSLYVAVLFEPKILKLLKEEPVKRDSLSAFKLGDAFLWVLLAALLGAFLKHDLKWLQVASLNVVLVCMFLYFLQGLAVTADTFARLRMTPFWQFLAYLILVTQLILVVCFVGIADFWFDFRSRWKNKRQENLNREFF